MKKALILLSCMAALNAHAQIFGGDIIYVGESSLMFASNGSVSTIGTAWSTYRSTTDYGAFVFEGTASVTGADDTHNVDGYVRHFATAVGQMFTYPVGSGTDLRAVTVSGTVPADFNVAVAWNVTTDISGLPGATLGSGIASVYPQGYWNWNVASGTTAGTTVSVSIPDIATLFPAQDPLDLRLVGWNGTAWIALGTVGTLSTAENTLLTGTIPSGETITAITVGSISNALPVTLLSFTGTANGCDAVLKWSSAHEDNFKNYEIEWSKDGITYNKVGTVAAGKANYSFVYAQESGLGLYRLKMNDRDGSYTYSDQIVRVRTSCNEQQINVYPNPVTDRLMINGLPENVSVSIYDVVGKTLIQQAGSKSLELNVSNFANGTYYLVIRADNNIILTKELVKK